MSATKVILIAHNIRSTHNIGSLLRTAEGMGVEKVYFTGYSPYPAQSNDLRLPHLARKLTQQIHKTALGAELLQPWHHHENIIELITSLKKDGYVIAALEQTPTSVALNTYKVPNKAAIILGREVEGIEPAVLAAAEVHLEIPMRGQKESFNVVQAAAMALYYCNFGQS